MLALSSHSSAAKLNKSMVMHYRPGMLVRGDAKNYQEPGGNFQYELDETDQVYKTRRINGKSIQGKMKEHRMQEVM